MTEFSSFFGSCSEYSAEETSTSVPPFVLGSVPARAFILKRNMCQNRPALDTRVWSGVRPQIASGRDKAVAVTGDRSVSRKEAGKRVSFIQRPSGRLSTQFDNLLHS